MRQQFAIGLLAAVGCAGAQAGIVFQDNFESGDISTWSVDSNYDGDTGAYVRSDFVHSGANALGTFIDLPSDGSAVSNRYVRASHEFTVVDAGDHVLDLWGANSGCNAGCSLSYQVLLDDVLIGTWQSPDAFQQVTQTLSGLAAGLHTLTLGLFADGAANGRYTASFDDVTISSIGGGGGTVPEPQSLALVLAALAAGAALRRRTQTR